VGQSRAVELLLIAAAEIPTRVAQKLRANERIGIDAEHDGARLAASRPTDDVRCRRVAGHTRHGRNCSLPDIGAGLLALRASAGEASTMARPSAESGKPTRSNVSFVSRKRMGPPCTPSRTHQYDGTAAEGSQYAPSSRSPRVGRARRPDRGSHSPISPGLLPRRPMAFAHGPARRNLVLDPSLSGYGGTEDFAIIQPKRSRTIASSDQGRGIT
jgi:hypothetical protein